MKKIISSFILIMGMVTTYTAHSQTYCNVSSNIAETPLPVSGAYNCGQTVEFCYTVTHWDQYNDNWFHGVCPTFGSGWDTTTLAIISSPSSCDGNGTWSWYPNGVTSTATGVHFPPGWYYLSSEGPGAGSGGPGNNFGDDCTSYNWTFCLSIKAKQNIDSSSDLSVTFRTSADGESGGWSSTGCHNDTPTVFHATGSGICPYTNTIVQSICLGSSYSFEGQNLTASGTYSDTFTAVNGQDSIITLVLNTGDSVVSAISQNICPGSMYIWGADSIHSAGVYVDTLTSVAGCDSIVTLSVSFYSNLSDSISHSITAGDTFSFGGHALTAAGIYLDTFTSVHGCDSIVTLDLMVLPNYNDSFCNVASSITETPPPVNGTYNSGQTVEICYTVTHFIQINDNWFHGVQPTFGSGWDTMTYTPISAPAGCDGNGTWNWYPNGVTSTATGLNYGPGWYYHSSIGPGAGVGGPGNNYGDNCTNYNWTFCLTIKARQNIDSTSDLSITFRTTADGQSGGWADDGCNNDTPTVFHATGRSVFTDTIVRGICLGSGYNFGGQNLSVSGVYTDTFTSVHWHDSIITLILTTGDSIVTGISQGLCPGSVCIFGADTISVPGTYIDTLTSVAGCDSIVTLIITPYPNFRDSIAQSICPGGAVSFGGQSLTGSGTYTDTFTSVHGCDSVVTLVLTVLPVRVDSTSQYLCHGGSLFFGGHLLTTSGSYADTLTSALGCDSIIRLTLTVFPATFSNLYDTLVTGDTLHIWSGSYFQSGVYTDTFAGIHGCDSVVTLYLYVASQPTFAHLFDTICQGFSVSVSGHTYTVSGTYIDTLTGYLGGDSIVTLNLTVTQTLLTNLIDTIPAGGADTIGAHIYTQSGVYVDTLPGIYGCDSIVSLHLTVGPLGISLISSESDIRLYPNPNSGSFTLQTSGSVGAKFSITDILGKVICQQTIRSDNQAIELPEAAEGVYIFSVKGAQPVRFEVVR